MDGLFQETLVAHFGLAEANRLLLAMEDEPTHSLILNTRKLDVDSFLSRFPKLERHPFIENAFYYSKQDYDFGKSILHASGAIYIQDAAAMMVSHLLGVKTGDACIDLCAAPGGKTIDVAVSGSPSFLVCNDLSTPRARELSNNIERMGIDNAIVTNSNPEELLPLYEEAFDKVILDAPCSGSAMFRKNDLAKSDWNMEKVLRCARTQASLLDTAFRMLKPGGELIYSTCSFSKEENEEAILSFLDRQKGMEVVPLPEDSLFLRAPSLKEAIYLLPSHFKGEGQFICKLRKISADEGRPTLRKPAKNRKTVKNIHELQAFLEKFGLADRYLFEHGKCLFALPSEFPVDPIRSIRPGLKINEEAKVFIPDYASSHAISSAYSIPLTLEQAKAYLRGEAFRLNAPEGFQIVSYSKLNLGYVKVVNGLAKNHYPKGLRQDYSKIDY